MQTILKWDQATVRTACILNSIGIDGHQSKLGKIKFFCYGAIQVSLHSTRRWFVEAIAMLKQNSFKNQQLPNFFLHLQYSKLDHENGFLTFPSFS